MILAKKTLCKVMIAERLEYYIENIHPPIGAKTIMTMEKV